MAQRLQPADAVRQRPIQAARLGYSERLKCCAVPQPGWQHVISGRPVSEWQSQLRRNEYVQGFEAAVALQHRINKHLRARGVQSHQPLWLHSTVHSWLHCRTTEHVMTRQQLRHTCVASERRKLKLSVVRVLGS